MSESRKSSGPRNFKQTQLTRYFHREYSHLKDSRFTPYASNVQQQQNSQIRELIQKYPSITMQHSKKTEQRVMSKKNPLETLPTKTEDDLEEKTQPLSSNEASFKTEANFLSVLEMKDKASKNVTNSERRAQRNAEFLGSLPSLFLERSTELDPSSFSNESKCLVVEPEDQTIHYEDAWDEWHVKLPCSPQNTYTRADCPNIKLPKWSLIVSSFSNKIRTSYDLETAIMSYNPTFKRKWNFKGLHDFVHQIYTPEERNRFFDKILPYIVEIALQLPMLCKKPIPMLLKSVETEIILSQRQIASLLANAFLCTFPERSYSHDYPTVNFFELYVPPCDRKKEAKLRSLIHYFDRLSQHDYKSDPRGVVSFRRQVLSEFPRWSKSNKPLSELHVHAEGTIEDNGTGMLQVDFANKYIGGGILSHGCVQEEIRFCINPELIVSRLFTPVLEDNECLIIVGAERFSTYSGYGATFRWTGDFRDPTPRDHLGRIKTSIVAIDALNFTNPEAQYTPELIKRELNKAFCGFCVRSQNNNNSTKNGDNDDTQLRLPVATGNWGCGAFGGHKELKSLIQLMAASEAEREIHYFTFGDKDFAEKLETFYRAIVAKQPTTGDLFAALKEYAQLRKTTTSELGLFEYLLARFS
jgi:poly(ADP-ribose) glycohydrolase